MIGDREATVFYDERVLSHRPDADDPFLPGKLDKRVREILAGLPAGLAATVYGNRPVIAVGIVGLVAASLILTLSPFRSAVMPAAYA